MRKALLFISVAILCLNANAQNIFRIDNNPGHVADFTDFQTAHDDEGVVDGDILYVAGSGTSYGTVTISKSIFVYGPGYFLTSNLGESAEVSPALFGLVTFVASGPDDPSGAMISGLTTGQIDVNASNITIKRNDVTLPIFLNTTGNFSVSNVLIIQNYIIGPSGSGSLGMIHFSGGTVFFETGIIIRNNFIQNNTSGGDAITMFTSDTATIENNIFNLGDLGIVNSVFRNNLLLGNESYFFDSNTAITNNISPHNVIAMPVPENLINESGTLFDGTSSPDGQFQLAGGSPAEMFGVGNVDAGIYGGPEPYVLSGVPALPTITEIIAPLFGSPSAGLDITVKAKARN